MEIILQKGEMLVFEGERRGRRVRCAAGLLWITQEGDRRDHLLRRGKNFTSSLPGRIVVTALGDSHLSAAEPQPGASHAYALPLGMTGITP